LTSTASIVQEGKRRAIAIASSPTSQPASSIRTAPGSALRRSSATSVRIRRAGVELRSICSARVRSGIGGA
jgi:hypothetical protein